MSKEIKLLSDLEHVLKVPEVYVSSTTETDEMVNYLDDNNIIHSKIIGMNVGMYKLLWEIFDNSIDEIRRSKGKSRAKSRKKHFVEVHLNTFNNEIRITDNGDGFFQAIKHNKKSKVSNIETAYCFLKSGSNFDNEGIDEKLVGSYGIGGSLVNMLSDKFKVISINPSSKFEQSWEQFVAVGKPNITRSKFSSLGTTVLFIPRKSIFGDSKFDTNIIKSQLAFRKRCMLLSHEMENMEVSFWVDNERIKLPKNFFHEEAYIVENGDFLMAITPKYGNSSDFLMINSTQCMGSPIRYVQDMLNDNIFKHNKANNYFDVQIMMNLSPNMVKFGDPNKTKYSVPKNKIAPHLQTIFKSKHVKFPYRFIGSPTYLKIIEDMEKVGSDKEQKAILKGKRKVKKLLKKYLPAVKKDTLFIVEGESAKGSIAQGRNPLLHGIYQLKGKIQNCRKMSDLRSNQEIMELISIIDLRFDSPATAYQNIVIATDFDVDGIGHIASLLINFFYRWYPQVVTHNKLFILKVPLVSYGVGKNIRYIYSLKEWDEYKENPDTVKSNRRYLKGLGALNPSDWDRIIPNMQLMRIKATPKSLSYLDMAFGVSSELRKQWLDKIASK